LYIDFERQCLLDPFLWAFILKENKVLSVIGGWTAFTHEEIQIYQLSLVLVRPIHLFHILHLGNERKGGFLRTEEGKAAENLENLVMYIVKIYLTQKKSDHSALCREEHSNLQFILDYF
jgi:hypothetical protein